MPGMMQNLRLSFTRLVVALAMLLVVGCSSTSTSGNTETSQPNTSGDPVATTTSAAEETSFENDGATEETKSVVPGNTEADIALISAASRGDTQAVKRFLEQGADVHTRDGTGGTTPLIAAAYGNHVETARILIEVGADVNVKDETQQSAYLISTSEIGDDPRLLKLTLANGADVRSLDSYNGTGLIRAAERGYVRVVQELLKTEVAVDHVNNLGWTALLEAIILGDCGPSHTEVVRLLVEAGADVSLADGNSVTPLLHARQQNCTGIAEILEDAGAT